MENISPFELKEVIFASSDPQQAKQLSKLLKAKRIRKIAPRVYTSNLNDQAEDVIRRNLLLILGTLYPGAVLSHRSAFEFQPTMSGHIFLTYSYTKKIKLGDVTLRFLEGPPAMDGDNPISGELHVSQKARAFLENLQESRKQGAESKCLPLHAIEEKLELIIRVNGEEALNQIRDQARTIAHRLGMEKELKRLNKLVGALLTSSPGKILSSPLAAARALGEPYDPARMELFLGLFRALQSREFKDLPDRNTTQQAFGNFAFFESYFSNYIEGTVFDLEDARKIVDTNLPIAARNEDSHDVLGTYRLASNRSEMESTPTTADELLNMLKYRHTILLSARLSKKPGQFKDRNNFAGSTTFVDFKLVKGTLTQAWGYCNALTHPFAKAAYMMFLISEVHPFLDGNGRIARIMMNAELVKAGQSKIIIPTVYREDYMGALRKLTRQSDPQPYIRMLERAHWFSAMVFGEDHSAMQVFLEKSNAFLEHTEGKLRF